MDRDEVQEFLSQEATKGIEDHETRLRAYIVRSKTDGKVFVVGLIKHTIVDKRGALHVFGLMQDKEEDRENGCMKFPTFKFEQSQMAEANVEVKNLFTKVD